MADTQTRQAAVEAAIAAVKSQCGDEAWPQIMTELLTEISISMAMLVDGISGSGSSGSSDANVS